VKQDALIIPNSALKNDTQGNAYAEVLVNGAPQKKNVQTGIANASTTEILSGLSEGDQVITQTIDPSVVLTSAASSSVRIPGLGGGGR